MFNLAVGVFVMSAACSRGDDGHWLPMKNPLHAVYSPDGQWLAACGFKEESWDLKHPPQIGKRPKSVRKGGVVVVWHAATLEEVKNLEFPDPVSSIAFAPDSSVLVTPFCVWDLHAGKEHIRFEQPIEPQRVVPEGTKAVATGRYGGTVRFWDLANGNPLPTVKIPDGPAGPAVAAALSIDGTRLAVGRGRAGVTNRGAIEVWDTVTGTKLITISTPNANPFPTFAPDGQRVAYRMFDDSGIYLAATDGSEISTKIASAAGLTSNIAFSNDGKLLAWAVATPKSSSIQSDPEYDAETIRIRVWSMTTKQLVTELKPDRAVYQLAIRPDGGAIAIIDQDRKATVFVIKKNDEK